MLYRGGYGSGKSKLLRDKAAQLAAINAGQEGMLVAPSHPMLVRNVLKPFLKAYAPIIARMNKQERWIELVNGSIIWWGTTEDPDSLAGPNLSWYVWDEPRYSPADAQDQMIARLRFRGAQLLQGFYATTPPPGGWVRDCFDREDQDQEDIQVSTRDNPFLDSGYVRTLEARYSASQCAAYIDGEWTSLEGSVLPEFDRQVHVIPYLPDASRPVVYGVDFGMNYQAAVFAQWYPEGGTTMDRILPPGSLVIFAEDNPGNMTTEDLARRAGKRFPADGALRLDWGACDPAGASTSSSASEHGNVLNTIAWKNGLAECGYHKPKLRYIGGKGSQVWRSINSGIEAMRGMLRDSHGQVRLYLSEDLLTDPSGRGIVKAFEGTVYRDGTQKILKGKLGGQLDHVFDAARYLVRHVKLTTPYHSQAA